MFVLLVVAGFKAVRDWWLQRKTGVYADVAAGSDVNLLSHIDKPIKARLLDGTVRLLRARWLLKAAAIGDLPRASPVEGEPAGGQCSLRMERLQDLLERAPDAFVPPQDAWEMFHRNDRSIIVLSYRCECFRVLPCHRPLT